MRRGTRPGTFSAPRIGPGCGENVACRSRQQFRCHDLSSISAEKSSGITAPPPDSGSSGPDGARSLPETDLDHGDRQLHRPHPLRFCPGGSVQEIFRSVCAPGSGTADARRISESSTGSSPKNRLKSLSDSGRTASRRLFSGRSGPPKRHLARLVEHPGQRRVFSRRRSELSVADGAPGSSPESEDSDGENIHDPADFSPDRH